MLVGRDEGDGRHVIAELALEGEVEAPIVDPAAPRWRLRAHERQQPERISAFRTQKQGCPKP